MIETRAPGKLFIAGEYAVVEPGEPAVLVAVDRYLTVRLVPSDDVGKVHSSEYGKAPVLWTRAEGDGAGGESSTVSIVIEHQPYDYVLSAITVMERLRAERGLPARYFDLHISSELDDSSGRKFGLGSSAAVTVAVIAALDAFYGTGLGRTDRYRMALLATIEVAPNASGGDLAASTFGGWIRYTAPDRARLRADLARLSVTDTLDSPGWEPFSVRALPEPPALRLLVGWTGSPASTERLVGGVRPRSGGRRAGAGAEEPSAQGIAYADFVAASRESVDSLVESLTAPDGGRTPELVRRHRRLLQGLGISSGIAIETDELRLLCDTAEEHGAAGKPSGAGGGDCGIVLAPVTAPQAELLAAWEATGIRRLDLAVHPAVPAAPAPQEAAADA